MDNFVAIDFETANNVRSSVCSVGLVFVRDGKIVDERYSLIKPFTMNLLPAMSLFPTAYGFAGTWARWRPETTTCVWPAQTDRWHE